MPSKDKYTDPKLRDEVKEEIHQSDKGGAPGQWSARKAQMMATEYKKRGGSYTTDKETGQDESQKNLDNWTEEEWQTKEGSGTARQDDGSRKRYLPKKAWEQMDEEEKEQTEEKKVKESKKGKQFVGNTDKAKSARKNVSEKAGDDNEVGEKEDEKKEGAKTNGQEKNTRKSKQKDQQNEDTKEDEEEEEDEDEEEEDEDDEEDEDEKENKTNGKKGGAGTKRSAKQSNASNKKQETEGDDGAIEEAERDEEYQEGDAVADEAAEVEDEE